jgi:hypothetical protein
LLAVLGKLVRQVVHCAADLLGDLLSKRTLDGELLGKLPERRHQLRRIVGGLTLKERSLRQRILRQGIELSGPGGHLLPYPLLPKLVTEPWVT